jgi:arabinofuranosyltransferase
VPTLVLGLSVYFPMWAVSGLETPLFAFLLLLCADLYLRGMDGSRRSFAASALVIWLLGCTRPEGFFIAAAFVVHLLMHGRASRTTAGQRLTWLALFGLGVVALTVFRRDYYGAWLPNTFYAKVGVPRLWMVLRGIQQSVEGVLGTVGLPLLILVPIAWARSRAPRIWSLAILIIVFGVAFVIAAGGDWMPGYRFLMPFLPWFALLLEASLRVLMRGVSTAKSMRLPERLRDGLAAGAIVVAGLVIVRARIVALNETYVLQPLHRGGTLIQPTYVETASWVRTHVPVEDWVAVGEAGVIPFFAPQRFVDMLALNDAYLARQQSRFSADYVLQRAPQYVLLAGIHRGATRLQSQYGYGESLLQDERFAAGYRPCRSFGPPPERFSGRGQNFMLYARRDCDCDPQPTAAAPP